MLIVMMMMIEDDDFVERAMKIMMVLNPKRTFAFSRVFFRATLTSRNGTEKGIHDQTQSEEDEGKKPEQSRENSIHCACDDFMV